MFSVKDSVDGNRSTPAPTLELDEIQATVLRPRLGLTDVTRAFAVRPAPASWHESAVDNHWLTK